MMDKAPFRADKMDTGTTFAGCQQMSGSKQAFYRFLRLPNNFGAEIVATDKGDVVTWGIHSIHPSESGLLAWMEVIRSTVNPLRRLFVFPVISLMERERIFEQLSRIARVVRRSCER